MTSVGLLILAFAAPPASGGGVVSVRMEPALDGRSAVVIVLSETDGAATARREGSRVVVEVPGAAPTAFALPRPLPPVVEMGFEEAGREAGRLVLQLAAPYEFEALRDGRELRLLFAAHPAAEDVESLVPLLFPAESRPARVAPEGRLFAETRGWGVRLNPTVSALYAQGNNSFEDGPQPREDSYYEVAPRLEASTGSLRLAYETHLRGGSRYDAVNSTPTHAFDAQLDRQLANDTHLAARYTFLRGRSQASEVDPGGEYFYGYQRFRKQGADSEARIPVGGATGFVFGGGWNDVRFDHTGAFLDYASWDVHGGLRREIGAQTSLAVFYRRDETYRASDPDVVGSTADTVDLALIGELRPQLTAHVSAGISRRHSPGAPSGAQELTDVVARVNVRRELSDRTALALSYTRARNASAFERNPSYRSDAFDLRGNAPLPLMLSLAASAGFHQNSYPLDAAEIGAPRRDRTFGWAAGLGRSLGSRAVAHAEYHWLRRTSNLSRYSSVSHALLIQLDVTPLRRGTGR